MYRANIGDRRVVKPVVTYERAYLSVQGARNPPNRLISSVTLAGHSLYFPQGPKYGTFLISEFFMNFPLTNAVFYDNKIAERSNTSPSYKE